MTPRVLLIGSGGSHTPAEIPHVFEQAGCAVEIFCPSNSWLRKNSYRHTWYEARSSDYAVDLQAHLTRHAYDWLVPVDDAALYALAHVGAADTLPVTKPESVELLGSKAGFSRLCSAYGITTPPYVVGDACPERLEQDVGYPLLVKVDKSSGGLGVHMCADKDEVRAVIERLSPDERDNLVFQRYVLGENISVEALYKHGALCGYVSSRVVQTLNGEFGISTERLYDGSLVPRSLLDRVGEQFGLNGFSSITFIRDKGSALYMMVELDPRPQAWLRVAQYAGVDFARVIRIYLGFEAGAVMPPSMVVRAWHFYRDVRRCSTQGDWSGLWAWVTNKEGRWRFVPWYDKKLFVAVCGQLLWHCARAPLYRVYGKLTNKKRQP